MILSSLGGRHYHHLAFIILKVNNEMFLGTQTVFQINLVSKNGFGGSIRIPKKIISKNFGIFQKEILEKHNLLIGCII